MASLKLRKLKVKLRNVDKLSIGDISKTTREIINIILLFSKLFTLALADSFPQNYE